MHQNLFTNLEIFLNIYKMQNTKEMYLFLQKASHQFVIKFFITVNVLTQKSNKANSSFGHRKLFSG